MFWVRWGIQRKYKSENASSGRLQEVKNNGKSLTVRLRKWSRSLIYRGGGSLQQVPTVRLWLGNFWCFGLTVAYGRGGYELRELVAHGGSIYTLCCNSLFAPIMQFFLSPSINWRLLTTLLFDEKMLYETFLTLGLFRLLFCRTWDQAVLYLFFWGGYRTVTLRPRSDEQRFGFRAHISINGGCVGVTDFCSFS